MAETVIGKLADGRILVLITTSGPSSYSSGGFTYSVATLKKVEAVISAQASGGYKAETSISGDKDVVIKVYYYDYDAAGDGPAIEVAGGTDLSGVTFTLVVLGF